MEFLSAKLPQDIIQLELSGKYDKTREVIKERMKTVSGILKERLEYELERIDRLLKEYSLTEPELIDFLKENINDFSIDEFKELKVSGYFDIALIGGVEKYQKRNGLSVLKAIPRFKNRIKEEDHTREAFISTKKKMITDMITHGKKEVQIHLKASLKLKPEAVPKGEKVRVWLPIPRVGDQIKEVEILTANPEPVYISNETYPQRTVYFEKISGEKNEFMVEYKYKTVLNYVNPDPKKCKESDFKSCLNEQAPHIVFSPHIKRLAGEIVGDETNPLLKARKIYDFITTKFRYSFMRSYSTYENLVEFAASNLKGDCGVQAALFITLCRISGVPAKWQSGLVASEQFVSPHDWAQFYVEPYGWLFADLSVGGSSWNAGNYDHWNFYFGNLDPLRMIANSEFQYPLEPVKKFYRTDPYDNQVGEAEWEGGNIYVDQFESIRECLNIEED